MNESFILPRPKEPYEAGKHELWEAAQSVMGLEFPQEYRDYIDSYGTGVIGGQLLIYNPFSTHPCVNLYSVALRKLAVLRGLKKNYGDEKCPFLVHPKKGGLFPVGEFKPGHTLYWLPTPDSNNWKLILNKRYTSVYETFEFSLARFIRLMFEGKLTSEILAGMVMEKDSLFEAGLSQLSRFDCMS